MCRKYIIVICQPSHVIHKKCISWLWAPSGHISGNPFHFCCLARRPKKKDSTNNCPGLGGSGVGFWGWDELWLWVTHPQPINIHIMYSWSVLIFCWFSTSSLVQPTTRRIWHSYDKLFIRKWKENCWQRFTPSLSFISFNIKELLHFYLLSSVCVSLSLFNNHRNQFSWM